MDLDRIRELKPAIQPAAGSEVKITIVLAAILFVISRGYIFFKLDPLVTDVPSVYFQHAASVVDGHKAAYQEEQIEYPPLAWWTICLPRLLDSRRIANPQDVTQVEPIFKAYYVSYRIMMFLCDTACFAMLFLIAWTRRRPMTGWVVLAYTVMTTGLGYLIDERLDVAMLLLLLLWAFCWLRSLDMAGHCTAWTAAAYTILGLSISFKLIPIICTPILLLSEWHVPPRVVRIAVAIIGLAVGIGVPFGIQYAASGPGVFNFLGHHAERGIQIESLYAGFILLSSVFGSPIFIQNTHGAFEVFSDLSSPLKVLSSSALMVFPGGVGLWALLRWSRYRREEAFCASCFVLVGIVILSNVFSPQYLIWAIPLMLLLAMEVFPDRWRVSAWLLFALLLLLVAMTTWIFPCNYFRGPPGPAMSAYGLIPRSTEYSAPSSVACVMVFLRNLLYFGIVAWLGVMFFRRAAATAPTASAIDSARNDARRR